MIFRNDIQYHGLATKNPFFHKFNYEIHFPFSYEEYENENRHKVALMHEYYHLLQAVTTTHGIYKSIGIFERFIYFLHAIQGKKTIKIPLISWSKSCKNDKALSDYESYEEHFNIQVKASDGIWKIKIDTGNEFEITEQDIPIGSIKKYKRKHITRKFNGSLYAMPILADILSEAQAECCTKHILDVESILIGNIGNEKDFDHCLYNTIPGYVSRTLPNFPLETTVFFLTEFSLMSYAVDEAFYKAVNFLMTKETQIPHSKADWTALWNELCIETPLVTNSLIDLRNEINRKVKLYGRHNSHPLITCFITRLHNAIDMLNIRACDPLFFFDWESKKDVFINNLFSKVPIPHAYFIDEIRSFGTTEIPNSLLQSQTLFTSIMFLFDIFNGNKGKYECPYYSDKITCTESRAYECKTAPWAKSVGISKNICSLGFLGNTLNINDSVVEILS